MHVTSSGEIVRVAYTECGAASSRSIIRRDGRGLGWLTALAVCFVSTSWAIAQTSLEFIGIKTSEVSRDADEKLCRYLERKARLTLTCHQEDYESAIQTVAERRLPARPYLARMTPYACVAAEMLGASLDVLATYQSKATQSTTYHSYFVVRRSDFPAATETVPPSFRDLLDYLRKSPRAFMYHDRFSTSSYFLPSLYFRREQIFDMPSSVRRLTALTVKVAPKGKTSSFLVGRVANGGGDDPVDFSAVWDGTKADTSPEINAKVWFIQLPDVIPNDLLVASKWLPDDVRKRISNAIGEMKDHTTDHINIGDFLWWEDIGKASDVSDALSALRQLAAAPASPVTVQITQDEEGNGETKEARKKRAAVPDTYMEAARQAVRLAGTEFVLHVKGYHKSEDVTWTLDLIHDGAVMLTSQINGFGDDLPPQKFPISFMNSDEDLTRRIVTLIHTRMNRIRYVWPYQNKYPAVIRDVDFAIPQGTDLRVRKIAWVDPEHDEFDFPAAPFVAKVEAFDGHKFHLDGARFTKAEGGTTFDFDPMSNTAYRVVLVRPSLERGWLKWSSVSFIAVLSLLALGAVMDFQRRSRASNDGDGADKA